MEITSRYRAGTGRAYIVRVSDLSRSGCMLHQNYSVLKPGKMITIRLGEIGPIEAMVRWQDGLALGLRFLYPLHPAMMDFLAQKYGVVWSDDAA